MSNLRVNPTHSVVTALAQAALSREDTPELLRKPFYLYTDEFQTYANNSFAIILSEARKYKLNLTLGHQYLRQLPPDLQHSTLGNSANFISFRVGVEDGELLANHIGLKPQLEYNGMGSQETKPADALMRLPNFKAWGRFLVDGSPSEPVPIDMLPPPIPINHRPHRMITNSRMHFGRPRASVEANINAFLQAK